MPDDVTDILRQIATVLPTLATKDDVAAIRNDVASLDRSVTALEDTVESHRAETRKGFADMDEQIRRMSDVAELKGRVEEHSQMLQLVLAGRMTRSPAA